MTAMSYVTVPNRPLLSVGTWRASTGEEVITEADLAEILRAASSGVLDAAVIKKGHTDPRYSEFNEDGDPAFGQVTNLRISEGTLYGDFVRVPAELAESLDSAYPHVSVELARNVKLRDDKGRVHHSFEVVLTAAALLGATAPAVKGLTQKAAALSEDAYDYTTLLPSPDVALAAGADAPAGETPEGAEATPEVALPGEAEGTGTDPVETGAEATEQAPAPEPADVKDDTVDVPPVTPKFTQPARETDPPAAPPTADPPTADLEGTPTMPTIDEQAADLRAKYGLADNASYKDLLAKVLEDNPVPGKDVAPGTDETPNDERAKQIEEEIAERQKLNLSEEKPKDQQTKAPEALELDNVYVSRSAFAEFQAEFEATKAELAARREREVKTRRDEMVRSWFSAGLLHPTEVEKVREQLDVAEETVVALTEARTPLPVHERGHAKADELHFALGTDETKTDALMKADDAIFGA